MSDVPPNGKHGLGVQAYRWLVVGAMAMLTLLSQRTLAGIDKTADAVSNLQVEMRTMQATTASRFDAHADRLKALDDRNNQQDSRMDRQESKLEQLANKVWQALPSSMRGNP